MKFALFFAIVLSIWALMHLYVFWRLSSVPRLEGRWRRRYWVLAGFLLWAGYPAVRILESYGWDWLALPLAYLASTWVGILFLLVAAMLAADLLTLGGWVFRNKAPLVRGAAAAIALLLSLLGLAQGLRAPVIRQFDVELAGLPPERDGTRLVMLSDLHLGTILRENWLVARVRQVRELKPDLICLVGDIVDGDNRLVQPMVPVLQQLQAPLGTWVVSGNHEFYAGLEGSLRLFESAGFRVLRDTVQEVAPGLSLAGVDDLTARGPSDSNSNAIVNALSNRPAGSTILLSHTPWEPEVAAANGVDLMLSGHTHNGQIWPFNYLVRLRYPLVVGRNEIDGMTFIIGRGTGTWGPPMRLWRPSEILLIRLKSPAA